jgi:hypothetical protein
VVSEAAFTTRVERIRADHEARARAELTAADAQVPGSDTVPWAGALIAQIVVVKGLAGPAEAAGGPALSGADGEAVTKALEALGWPADTAFFTLSRPEPTASPESIAARIRGHIEAVDPIVVVALDAEAAEDVARAFGLRRLAAGETVTVAGRRVVAVDAFEAALSDETQKRKVWTQLRAAQPDGPVY